MKQAKAENLKMYAAAKKNDALLYRRMRSLGLRLVDVVRSQGDCLPDSIAWLQFKGTPQEWLKQRSALSAAVRATIVKFLREKPGACTAEVMSFCLCVCVCAFLSSFALNSLSLSGHPSE